MKKRIYTIFICIIVVLGVCGCTKNKDTKEITSTYKITEVKNVTADIFDITLTSATIIIKDTNIKPYIYGKWYKIEKEENGKWYQVKTIAKNYYFNEIGYEVDENNEVKFIIDWTDYYGELEDGSYRIIKEVNNQYISIPFNIATSS